MSLRRPVFEAKRLTVLRSRDRVLREYARIDRLQPEAVLTIQREQAIEYARYAMANTEFYREFYTDAGLTLEDLRDPEVFGSLPVVEKEHVRDNFDAFQTPEATKRNTVRSMTGGSTGQPLHSLRDTRVSVQPIEWRLFGWWGINPSDNIALVSRLTKSRRQKAIQAAKWWPSKRIQLDAYRINEAEVRAFVDDWQRVRPALLTGYAGGILELARNLRRLDIEIAAPVAIATTASPLTVENREEVQSVLRAPVYDHYRSSEIPYMGGECRERAGHHVFAESRVLELVGGDDRRVVDGQYGEVVATDMTNRVFPLIRYRLGDRSRVLTDPCRCGISLPRIDRVTGRTTDGLRLPDGTWVDGAGLYQIFSATPTTVRQYQIDQRADYSVIVRCVRGTDPDAERSVEQVMEVLRGKLGHAVQVEWEFVDHIPHEGGKIRYIRSAVA